MLGKLRELPAVARLARIWWSAPVDYDAQIGYFAQRGLLGGVQLLVGACAALLAVIAIVAQASPSGADTAEARIISSAFAATAVVWALVWWFGPWPSRTVSIAFIVYADIGISSVAMLDANRLAGFFGLNAMLLISMYVKFFEGPKGLAVHTVWVLLVTGGFALSIAVGSPADPYLALAKSLVAIATFVVLPMVVQFGIWVLRNDANESVTDHLTGLLNRRGLNMRFGGLVSARDGTSIPGDAVVVVIVIDLDRFKLVNDTYGHAMGDAVLVRSADRITHAVRSGALVARVGGEEFVVVDIAAPGQATAMSERVRSAIAERADEAPVTASVGVATVPLTDFASTDVGPHGVLDAAIDCADHAMLAVKRSGGDGSIRRSMLADDGMSCECTASSPCGDTASRKP